MYTNSTIQWLKSELDSIPDEQLDDQRCIPLFDIAHSQLVQQGSSTSSATSNVEKLFAEKGVEFVDSEPANAHTSELSYWSGGEFLSEYRNALGDADMTAPLIARARHAEATALAANDNELLQAIRDATANAVQVAKEAKRTTPTGTLAGLTQLDQPFGAAARANPLQSHQPFNPTAGGMKFEANGPEQAITAGTDKNPMRWDRLSGAMFGMVCQDHILVTGDGTPHAYEIATGVRRGREGFRIHCNAVYGVAIMYGANDKEHRVSFGDMFWGAHELPGIEWRTASHVTMEPTSAPDVFVQGGPFNRWQQMKHTRAEPDGHSTRADIAIFENHLLYLCDGWSAGVERFLELLAFMHQHPEVKQPIAPYMVSRLGGVGKSMIFKLLAAVFGPPLCTQMKGQDLIKSQGFSSRLEGFHVAFVNEVQRDPKGDMSGSLKDWIDSDTISIERKKVDAKTHKNILQFFLTSNRMDAIELMDSDRRYLVMRCTSEPKSQEYYRALMDWMQGDGPAALANVLSTWVFPKGWDPHAPAPQSMASKILQHDSRSPRNNFLAERIAERKGPFAKQIVRGSDLYFHLESAYPALARTYKLDPQSIAYALGELGYTRLVKLSKKGIPSTNPSYSCWCLGNPDYWNDQPAKVWNDYLTDNIVPDDMPPWSDDDE